jgi:hypothetical protein
LLDDAEPVLVEDEAPAEETHEEMDPVQAVVEEDVNDAAPAEPAPELVSDESLLEAAQAEQAAPRPDPHRPPPPPIAPAEGEERSAAVRELSGLFDDLPQRPKRPAIRRLETTNGDGVTKRRVEDDEQVTKGLISRLIEGVKGL